MSFSGFALVILLLSWTSISNAFGQQVPLASSLDYQGPNESLERIAIIGAGIGGASAAFNIHELNVNLPPQSVTIFESEFSVGGRVQSAYLYPLEGGLKTIEDGATHFFADDWCLVSAMQQVGLKPRDTSWLIAHLAEGNTRTDLRCNAESTSWKTLLRGRWKYGQSWGLLHSAVQSALQSWNSFGAPHKGPFSSTLKELKTAGLMENVCGRSTTYLNNLTISQELQMDMIQPCTRGRFSDDLSDISGLSALIAAGKSNRISIDNGNSRLIERMINLSEAHLRLGFLVTAISPGFSRRYKLSITRSSLNEAVQEAAEDEDFEFDAVILATPLSKSRIDTARLNLRQSTVQSPLVQTHVTHFSSTIPLTSNLSVLPLDMNILKDMTVTTSSVAPNPNIWNIQRSSACFRRGCLPGDECDQCDEDSYLYRVHSRHYMQDKDILQTIGLDFDEGKKLSDYGIGYVRRRAWPYSYPQMDQERPNIVDEVEIAPKLYYLNGAESILSSMEMSCRMGYNVAHKASRFGRTFVL
jgi:hypothetical protein